MPRRDLDCHMSPSPERGVWFGWTGAKTNDCLSQRNAPRPIDRVIFYSKFNVCSQNTTLWHKNTERMLTQLQFFFCLREIYRVTIDIIDDESRKVRKQAIRVLVHRTGFSSICQLCDELMTTGVEQRQMKVDYTAINIWTSSTLLFWQSLFGPYQDRVSRYPTCIFLIFFVDFLEVSVTHFELPKWLPFNIMISE